MFSTLIFYRKSLKTCEAVTLLVAPSEEESLKLAKDWVKENSIKFEESNDDDFYYQTLRIENDFTRSVKGKSLTIREWVGLYGDDYGLDLINLEDCFVLIEHSFLPALCSEGCLVEHDNCCEHGNPSIFKELGLI